MQPSSARDARGSFDEYVATRSGVLLRFAYVLCGDRHLAEDLVQEVLVKAHRRWSAIEAQNPEAYLKQALVRTHVSWRRRRSAAEIAIPAVRDDLGVGRFDDEHASREEAWALLALLPRAQRAVLVLRYFEDLDDRRIAEVIGISPSTVRVHAHRGLAALRETLAQRAAEAPDGAGLLDSVRSGAERRTRRRRAAATGGVAALIAALALAIALLRPEPSPPPVEPTPSPSVTQTSDLVLLPRMLNAPVFPAVFNYLPPGIDGPDYVTMSAWAGPVYTLTFGPVRDGPPLQVQLWPTQNTWEAGETTITSQVTVNGAPATQWITGRQVVLEWPWDGQWLIASTDGMVSADDMIRFAEGTAAGTTIGARKGAFDQISSVALPPDYEITTWGEQNLCARPAGVTNGTSSLCIDVSLAPVGQFETLLEKLTIDDQTIYVYAPDRGELALVAERADGRVVHVRWSGTLSLNARDLIAIYLGIIFEQ